MSDFIRAATSTDADTVGAVAEIVAELASMSPAVVLVFHGIAHSGGVVAEAFSVALPNVTVVGCTTMGEIGPMGMVSSSITVFAMGQPCRVAAERISDLESFRFGDGTQLMGRLTGVLGMELEDLAPDRHVVLTLTDGLSSNEEQLFASLGEAVPNLALVGGSAGDDFELVATHCFMNSDAGSGGAVVILMEPGVAFEPFAIHQFKPGAEELVVTGADPERRLLTELNGWPAVRELARINGVPEEKYLADPRLASSSSTQLGFRVGESLFIRGIMEVTPEGLVLAAAVEEGMVLHTAESGDMLETTAAGVEDALESLGSPAAGMLLFNCGGRLTLAERLGQIDELFESMGTAPAAGFHTYGEHFGAVLVTYTLTGVAFGEPRAVSDEAAGGP